MIKSEREYLTTKTQAQKLQDALARTAKPSSKRQVHPLLRKAEQDALRSQLRDLRAEIREYQSLRSGDKTFVARMSLDEPR